MAGVLVKGSCHVLGTERSLARLRHGGMRVEDTISTDKCDAAHLSGMEIMINESLNAIRRRYISRMRDLLFMRLIYMLPRSIYESHTATVAKWQTSWWARVCHVRLARHRYCPRSAMVLSMKVKDTISTSMFKPPGQAWTLYMTAS